MIQCLEGELPALEAEAASKVLELIRLLCRRTGRNYQLLLKVRPDTAARFAALADAQGVCFGEFLETALDAHARETGARER